MPEFSLSDIDPHLRLHVEKARQACARGDFLYAIALARRVLEESPDCLSVRRLLREAQEQHATESRRWIGWLGTIACEWTRRTSIRHPRAGMRRAEQWLTRLPTLAAAHRLLGECAGRSGDFETACFAFVSWKNKSPDSMLAHLALTRASLSAGHPVEAMSAAEAMLERFPDHPEVRQAVKEAAVAVSLDQGRWADRRGFDAPRKQPSQLSGG